MNADKQPEIGNRVKKGNHFGVITGKSGEWYHIKWEDGWKTCCNYWGAWEFEVIIN